MRKLGILIATMAVALFGFAGTASAQEQLQEPLCDEFFGGFAEEASDSEIDDTTAGAEESCNESFENQKLVADPTLCGLEKDVTEEINEQLGKEGVGGVHGGLNQVEDGFEAEGGPDRVDFDHPCEVEPEDNENEPPGGDNGGNGVIGSNSGGSPDPEVKGKNQAADGGLPRTGGELFAGAGLGLAGLGTFLRRFLVR